MKTVGVLVELDTGAGGTLAVMGAWVGRLVVGGRVSPNLVGEREVGTCVGGFVGIAVGTRVGRLVVGGRVSPNLVGDRVVGT